MDKSEEIGPTTINYELDLEDFSVVFELLTCDSFEAKLTKTMKNRELNIIKLTNGILYSLADLDEKNQSPLRPSLKKFKMGCTKIFAGCVIPLMGMIEEENQRTMTTSMKLSSKRQVLVKWWGTYLCILDEVYRENSGKKGWSTDKKRWFTQKEFEFWESALEMIDDDLKSTIFLKKECVSRILSTPYHNAQTKNNQIIETLNYMRSIIVIELESKKTERIHIYISKILQSLQNLLEKAINKPEGLLASEILIGRFNKNTQRGLNHSVLFGDDSGFYALMNSVTDEEKTMLEKAGEISPEYSRNWELRENLYKIVIGKGSFGKIRLALALTRNSSNTMKAGQIVCLKKTAHVTRIDTSKPSKISKINSMKEIRKNCWNNYESSEVAKFIYSPITYDMKIIDNIDRLPEKHIKGYSMQQFRPFFDGKKAFSENVKGNFHGDWSHQRPYLISIFEQVLNLLIRGMCMTDLKLENTLYDPIARRGMLIDLAGVIIRPSEQDLRNCQLFYIKEFTPNYVEQEFLDLAMSGDTSGTFDLCASSAYSLGIICEKTGKETEDLKPLIEKLKSKRNERISVEEGLEILKSGDSMPSEISSLNQKLPQLITKLHQKTINQLGNFGLNYNLQQVLSQKIKLKCSEIDPEKHEDVDLMDLNGEVDGFIFKNKDPSNKVFVLLGSSGSGKSTIIQSKYLEFLQKWKQGDPFPFLMNLASDNDLKVRWDWLMEQIEEQYFKLSFFSGFAKYPMLLFLDSFDEVASKINFVSEFFDVLGRNEQNKFVVSCRSEFIQKEEIDFYKWFSLEELLDSPLTITKRYIAPLNQSNFNLEKYLRKNFKVNNLESLTGDIPIQNLKALLKTSYMVRLTMEILPELVAEGRSFSRIQMYEKYSKKQLEKESKRISNDNFSEFAENSAMLLARLLHEKGASRIIVTGKNNVFLKKHNYDSNLPCLQNTSLLLSVIRALDLHIETRDSVPRERIIIGFAHDTMKNFYLVQAIKKQLLERKRDEEWILGQKSIVDDEVLVRFLAEEVRENNGKNFREALQSEIFKSRVRSNQEKDISNFDQNQTLAKSCNEGASKSNKKIRSKSEIKFSFQITKVMSENNEEDKNQERVLAAANAITILVAANVWFFEEDFSQIRICASNLRDGNFVGCDFTEADLTGATMENCKLEAAIFKDAIMKDIKLGIYPDIVVGSMVWSCCFNKDASNILSGDQSNIVKLYKTSNGELLKTFEGHTSTVLSVAFSPDGKLIASASDDKSIKIWNKITGELIKHIDAHSKAINSVTFSVDGLQILSGSSDKTIKLWEVTTGKQLRTYEEHLSQVKSVSFSVDGLLFVSGSSDKTLKCWEKTSGRSLKTYNDHKDCVNCAAFSPDKKLIISGSDDNTLKLWDRMSGKVLKTLEGHKYWVNSVAFSHDGLFILSGSDDKTVKLWDRSAVKLLKSFEGHNNPVRSVCFSPNGLSILSGSLDKTIKLWDKTTEKLLKSFEGHTSSVKSVVFSPDGQKMLTGSSDTTAKLWDKSTGNLLKSFEGCSVSINGVAFSRDGQFVITGSDDNIVRVWYLVNGKVKNELIGHSSSINSVSASIDGFIVSGSSDKTLKLWDLASGELLKTLEGHTFNVNSVVFSHDSVHLLSGSSDQTVKLWSTATGELVHTFVGHTNFVNSVAFSPDNEWVVSGSCDKTVKLWDARTGELQMSFEGYLNSVRSVGFSPDGKAIFSGSSDRTVKLWDKSTGGLLKNFEGFSNGVMSVAFSPDGESFVTGDADQTVKLWNKTLEKKLSKSFMKHKNWMEDINYTKRNSPEGYENKIEKPAKLLKLKSTSFKKKLPNDSSGIKAELNVFFSFNFEYRCVLTIKKFETPLFCKEMILSNVEGLSNSNKDVFVQRGAIVID